MQDMLARLEKLRTDAAECALIRDLATEPAKRALFDRLANHLTLLADQVGGDAGSKERYEIVGARKRAKRCVAFIRAFSCRRSHDGKNIRPRDHY